MDLSKVEKLMQMMQSYGMQELELKEDENKIKLVQQQATPVQSYMHPSSFAPSMMPAPQSAPSPVTVEQNSAKAEGSKDGNLKEIKSPFVGTFYGAPSPGSDNFVGVGTKVKKGDTLCIVEAMKLMNEIEADQDGTIVEILVGNEEPVEYDQALFLIKP